MSEPTTRAPGCARSMLGIIGYFVTLVGVVILVAGLSGVGATEVDVDAGHIDSTSSGEYVAMGLLTLGVGVVMIVGSYVKRRTPPTETP